ncbi:MAG: sensor domain-containing diguanylate cyclase [Thermodesulfobacteriota bacterium]
MAVRPRREQSGIWRQPPVFMVAGAMAGAVAVAAGLYDGWPARPQLAGAAAVALLGLAFWYAVLRRDAESPTLGGQVVGPMLWGVLAWMAYRMLLPFSAHFILLPAATVAWLFTAYPVRALGGTLLLLLFMEAGLVGMGRQTLEQFGANLLACAALSLALAFFASSKAHRKRMRQVLARARRNAADEESARDFGLLEETPDILAGLPPAAAQENPDRYSRPALEVITAAFASQLALARESLACTTVALLWPDPGKAQMRLRGHASTRDDVLPGPFPVGQGITGALVGARQEVAACRAQGSFPQIPYYRRQERVGSVFALRIPCPEDEGWLGFEDRRVTPILCADRESPDEWSEEERALLRLIAGQLAQDLAIGRRLQALEDERGAFQRVCVALRELNGVLGLDQVLQATVRVVKLLVAADFVAISLLAGEEHRIAMVEGNGADGLQGLAFPREEGLVGQAMKIGRCLPARTECHGPMPVFSGSHRLGGYQSLLVIPLLKEKGEPLGALTIAGRASGLFSRTRQDILELIAAQVAVKVDLGQAHEQINRMATVDGLTGLANHRTFQHGFEVMLERAQRRKSPLCLILCDIDHFKQLNDNHGHPFGDQVLRRVGELLQRTVRTVDLAARYGGEEFAVVLEDSDHKGGLRMAERIRQAVELLTLHHQREPVRVTLSLGLAVYPADGEEKATLINRADQALYRAKQQGRNRAVAWEAVKAGE